jgi:hypothetical protein
VDSEDKSGFAAFQAILFTSAQFQPAAYTLINKSDIAVVKNWDKTLRTFSSYYPHYARFSQRF